LQLDFAEAAITTAAQAVCSDQFAQRRFNGIALMRALVKLGRKL
jgi:hypothetical protein